MLGVYRTQDFLNLQPEAYLQSLRVPTNVYLAVGVECISPGSKFVLVLV